MWYYYDFDGRPITIFEWSKMMNDVGRRLVAEDTVAGVMIRTMWLGTPDPCLAGDQPPLIYITMAGGEMVARWPDRFDALSGHMAVVAKIRAGGLADLLQTGRLT